MRNTVNTKNVVSVPTTKPQSAGLEQAAPAVDREPAPVWQQPAWRLFVDDTTLGEAD